jgi:hypothetical protein
MERILSYESKRPRRLRRLFSKGARIAACGAFVLLLAGITLPWVTVHTREQSICQDCGLLRTTVRPLDLSLFASTTFRPTAVTEVINHEGLAAGHTHHFRFLHLRRQTMAGFGWECPGPQNFDVYCNARNPQTATLLTALADTGNRAAADAWRTQLLNPDTVRAAERAMEALDPPFEPFASSADTAAWLSAHPAALTPPPTTAAAAASGR